jgi:hypothetical protein
VSMLTYQHLDVIRRKERLVRSSYTKKTSQRSPRFERVDTPDVAGGSALRLASTGAMLASIEPDKLGTITCDLCAGDVGKLLRRLRHNTVRVTRVRTRHLNTTRSQSSHACRHMSASSTPISSSLDAYTCARHTCRRQSRSMKRTLPPNAFAPAHSPDMASEMLTNTCAMSECETTRARTHTRSHTQRTADAPLIGSTLCLVASLTASSSASRYRSNRCLSGCGLLMRSLHAHTRIPDTAGGSAAARSRVGACCRRRWPCRASARCACEYETWRCTRRAWTCVPSDSARGRSARPRTPRRS